MSLNYQKFRPKGQSQRINEVLLCVYRVVVKYINLTVPLCSPDITLILLNLCKLSVSFNHGQIITKDYTFYEYSSVLLLLNVLVTERV